MSEDDAGPTAATPRPRRLELVCEDVRQPRYSRRSEEPYTAWIEAPGTNADSVRAGEAR